MNLGCGLGASSAKAQFMSSTHLRGSIADLRISGQIRHNGIRNSLPLRPVADRPKVDSEGKAQTRSRPFPKQTASLM